MLQYIASYLCRGSVRHVFRSSDYSFLVLKVFDAPAPYRTFKVWVYDSPQRESAIAIVAAHWTSAYGGKGPAPFQLSDGEVRELLAHVVEICETGRFRKVK